MCAVVAVIATASPGGARAGEISADVAEPAEVTAGSVVGSGIGCGERRSFTSSGRGLSARSAVGLAEAAPSSFGAGEVAAVSADAGFSPASPATTGTLEVPLEAKSSATRMGSVGSAWPGDVPGSAFGADAAVFDAGADAAPAGSAPSNPVSGLPVPGGERGIVGPGAGEALTSAGSSIPPMTAAAFSSKRVAWLVGALVPAMGIGARAASFVRSPLTAATTAGGVSAAGEGALDGAPNASASVALGSPTPSSSVDESSAPGSSLSRSCTSQA